MFVRLSTSLRLLGIFALATAVHACDDGLRQVAGPTDGGSRISPPASVARATATTTTTTTTTTNDTVTVTGLTRSTPLASTTSVSAWIGPDGGTIGHSAGGLKLTVPRGTLKVATLFTITAHAGSLVAYDFLPSGDFSKALVMVQDLKNTDWAKVPANVAIEVGYFASTSQIDFATKEAKLTEVKPTKVERTKSTLSFEVRHFSGYMLASGRKGTQ